MKKYPTSLDYFSSRLNSECVLFPTYAKRDTHNSNEWIVKVKGWALSHKTSSAKQKMMMSITKSVVKKSSTDQTSLQAFEERFKYFLATNQRHKIFMIQAIGITSVGDDEQDLLSTILLNQGYMFHSPPLTPPEEEDIRPNNPVSSVLDQMYTKNMSPVDQDNNTIQLKTSSSGFFCGEFFLAHDNILNWAQAQNQCDARLIRIQSTSTDNKKCLSTNGIVNLVEPCGVSIISDIDDTIKDTQILSGARTVLSKTFFESPKSVDGMANAYMSWYTQGASFHYVSNSPFQLIPMLDQFIRHSQFPPGSMHLRDESSLLSRLVEVPGQAKREAILEIIQDFPQRQFVLIGDSGEIDLEIYTRIASEYPDRILKIFIRDVTTPLVEEQKKKKARRPNQLSSIFYSKSQSSFLSSFSRKSSVDDIDVVRPHHSTPYKSTRKVFKSTSLSMRKAATLAEYAVEPHLTGHKSTFHLDDDDGSNQISTAEACTRLYERVEKARSQVPHIDIILFQDAQVLQNDKDVRNALWENWDNIANTPSCC